MSLPAVPPLAPIPFWFLRHGETDWNAQSLSQGNIDIPLNANGLAQAHAAAARLGGRGITTIVSSPLSRARVTAEIAGAALGLPIQIEEGLREVSFGEQEGQPMGDWYADWVADRFTPLGAESFYDLRVRAHGAISRSQALGPSVLVVAHGALFRAIRRLMGLEPNVRTQNALPMLCVPPSEAAAPWRLDALD